MPADVEGVLEALVEWLKMPEQTSLRRAFTVWLKRVLLPGRMPGVDFNKLNELHDEEHVGRARGRVDGGMEETGIGAGTGKRKEGEATLLERLLEKRFGPLGENLRGRIAEADADTLLRWGERIFQASTVEDVLRD